MGNTGFSTREFQIILIRWRSFRFLFVRDILHTWRMRKHREHRFDNSQTGGFLLILSDRFKKGSNTEFTVHFYLECKKRLKTILYQFLTLKLGCDLYTSRRVRLIGLLE